MTFVKTSGRPPPGAKILPPLSVGIGAPVDIPQLLPRSKLFIPQTRNISAEKLWDEKCKCVPHGQNWGCAWIDRVPDKPGKVFERFVIVPLKVFRTYKKAVKFQHRVQKKHKYKDRPFMIFQLGQWLALPVPVWLSSEDEQVDYTHNALVKLITNDTRSTNVRREVMKRRQKEDAEVLREADELTQPAYKTTAPDGSFVDVPQTGDKKELPTGHARYLRPDEETAILEATGRRYERPDADEEQKKFEWERPIDLISSRYNFGLMWVLPDIQSPGQKFKHVSFAWLGAYATESDLDAAQRMIKASHPEWSVVSFEIGTPLQLPIPQWIMQVNSSYVYDQETVGKLMMQDPNYMEPEEITSIMDAREMKCEQTVDHETMDLDLVNAIAPRDETEVHKRRDDALSEIPEGQSMIDQQVKTSTNKMMSLTTTQFSNIDPSQ